MNFKKSFAMCLSTLISLVPSSMHCMKEDYEHEDEATNINSFDVVNDGKCYGDESEDKALTNPDKCPVCLKEMFPVLDNISVMSCDHMICSDCFKKLKLNQNGEKECPLCGHEVKMENYHHLSSFWEKEFKANGIVDIRKLLEFEKLTDEQIIDYLISNYAKSGRFKRMFCNSAYKNQEEKAKVGLIQYETENGEILPLLFEDSDGKLIKVGISDEKLRRKLNKQFLYCSKVDWDIVNMAKICQQSGDIDQLMEIINELQLDENTLNEIAVFVPSESFYKKICKQLRNCCSII